MAIGKTAWLAAVVSLAAVSSAIGDDWPQWLGPNRDSVWRETGIVERFSENGPPVVWRQKIGGGYAGPSVAGDRVLVTDYLTEGDQSPSPQKRNELEGTERVLCYSAQDGKLLWNHDYPCAYRISYPAGPRVTPTVDEGRVYALGAEGDLRCLDLQDGALIWSKKFKTDYGAETPLWGFAGHPLVIGDALYCVVGGEGSVAVAFDKHTGSELWRALSAREPGYAPPTLRP
jgi:outer membrane protein assembly factor BamB